MSLVNGFQSAKVCSQRACDSVDTNADDTNVSGNIQMNPAELAASTDFTDRPM